MPSEARRSRRASLRSGTVGPSGPASASLGRRDQHQPVQDGALNHKTMARSHGVGRESPGSHGTRRPSPASSQAPAAARTRQGQHPKGDDATRRSQDQPADSDDRRGEGARDRRLETGVASRLIDPQKQRRRDTNRSPTSRRRLPGPGNVIEPQRSNGRAPARQRQARRAPVLPEESVRVALVARPGGDEGRAKAGRGATHDLGPSESPSRRARFPPPRRQGPPSRGAQYASGLGKPPSPSGKVRGSVPRQSLRRDGRRPRRPSYACAEKLKRNRR